MDITLNTNAMQDAILERLRIKTNIERAAEIPPQSALADIPALVRYVLVSAIQSYRQAQIVEDIVAIGAAYNDGNNAQRAAIRTAAGL